MRKRKVKVFLGTPWPQHGAATYFPGITKVRYIGGRGYLMRQVHETSPSQPVSTVTSPTVPSVYCGRGDRKTARGKRFNHSFGNARPRDKNKGRGPPKVPVTPAPPRKDKFEDDTIVKIEIDESLSSNY
ncbi:hypothetical protein SO802_005666 [Lithocarpus litseifolius]|uniref:Ribosomal protein S3 n=1 Tax=Lithocarpus litseifolius TaxID=425828 RepID=A0AAW2DLJ8_9ROSI